MSEDDAPPPDPIAPAPGTEAVTPAARAEPAAPVKRPGLAHVILADVGELGQMGYPVKPYDPQRRRLMMTGLSIAVIAVVGTGALIASGGLVSQAVATPAATPAATMPPTVSTEPSASSTAEPTASQEATEVPSPTAAATIGPSPTPSARPTTYLVQRDETLTILALRFGVTVDALVAANGIKDRNLILTGQTLIIPAP